MNGAAVQQWAANYAFRDLLLVLPALLVLWLYRRWVLRQLVPRPPVASAPLLLQFGYGVLLALAAILLSVLLAWIGGAYSMGAGFATYAYSPASGGSENGLAMWRMFAVQSLFEELLFRGIGMLLLGVLFYWLSARLLMPAAYQRAPLSVGARRFSHLSWLVCGTLSSAVVTVAFSQAHGSNPGVGTLALVNIALAGLVLGQLYWMQGTPLGAWALHLCWNAGLATLGLPVSGIVITPPLTELGFTGARAGLLSGGAFGPEGSLPNTIALALLALFLLWHMAQGLPPRETLRGGSPPDATGT